MNQRNFINMTVGNRFFILSLVLILCVLFDSKEVFCDETVTSITGIRYILDPKKDYSYDDAEESDVLKGTLNVISDGEVKEKDGVEFLDADSKVSLSFKFKSQFPKDLHSWHLISSSIHVSVYSSQNPEDDDSELHPEFDKWYTPKELYAGIDNFFSLNDIQLLNEYGYIVIIDYETERYIPSNKVFEDREQIGNSEVYCFYAYNSDEIGKSTSDSSIEPRKEYSKKQKFKYDSEYSIEQAIKSGDLHKGWDLGSFVVNGFSWTEDKSDGTPVFYKNYGDKVTLWFHLKQDIDKLNGDPKLTIAEAKGAADSNYDRLPKQNFKRGALIIQYQNEQGVVRDPIIYTDFLSANATPGADTRVILSEEGNYEVSLDYRIKDSRKKIGFVDAPASFADYKIVWKFYVRNGNSKVFYFDTVTGSELQDGSITENGFRIDTANSKYLQVSVKWEYIQKTDNGWKTVVGDNRGSSDKKKIYDEPGIYTIHVGIKDTTQSTEETIYVGTDPVYKALSKYGLTIQQLSEEIRNGAKLADDGTIIR